MELLNYLLENTALLFMPLIEVVDIDRKVMAEQRRQHFAHFE